MAPVDPPHGGQRGRLSPDYAGVSSTPTEVHTPLIGTSGRLGADYGQAVADLLANPSMFFRVILDEYVHSDWPGWPNEPPVAFRRVEGGYRLTAQFRSQFVAVGAPVAASLRDVLVGATFRKLGGPAGGTYGLLLRDRGAGPRDGRNQTGRYYVAQVHDQGEVAIWRRDQDRWTELVPWTRAEAVRPGESANDLSFEMVGSRMTLVVNGRPVASADDAVLDSGGVGAFLAGDGNDVLVERFVVHALD